MTRPLPPELYTVPIIGEVARWLNDVMEAIQAELEWLMTEIWNHLPDWIKKPIEVLKTFFENLPYELEKFFSDPIGYAYSFFYWVWEHLPWSIRYPLEKLRDFFLSLWNEFTEFFRDPLAKLRELAEIVWNIIPDWAKKPLETFAGFLGKIPYELEKFLEDPAGYAWLFLNWIYERLPPHFKAVISAAYSFFQSLYDKVSDFFQDPVKALSGLVEDITGNFNVAFDGVQTTISETIKSVFSDPLKSLSDGLKKLDDLLWPLNPLKWVIKLDDVYAQLLRITKGKGTEWAGTFRADLLNLFRRNVFEMGKLIDPTEMPEVPKKPDEAARLLKTVLDKVGDDVLTDAVHGVLWELFTLGQVEAFEQLANIAMRISGFDSALSAAVSAKLESTCIPLLRQYWLERSRPTLPSIDDLINMFRRGKINPDEFEKILGWMGYKEEFVDGFKEIAKALPSFWELIKMQRYGKLSESNVRETLKRMGFEDTFIEGYIAIAEEIPSETQLFDMWFRGAITDEELDRALKARGWTDKWREAFKQVMWYYPSVSDLIRFFVREAIPAVHGELARAKLVGIPKEFYEYGKKAGIPSEWVEAYWASHWVLPSTEQVYEMLHRGLRSPYTGSTMTEDDVKTFLREADIDPRWRENLVELSYKLPGRIEARWGVEWGVWDWTRMEEFLKADGIHPDWIPDTIKAEKANVFREHIGAVKSILVSKYQDGFISEEELKNRLQKLGYPDEAITYIIWSAQERYDYDWKKEMAKAYIDAYEDDKISADELRSALSGLGMIPDRIEHIIEMTTLKKEKAPPPPETLEKRLRTLEEREASLMRQLEDKRTDLEDLKKLYEAEMAIYDERIEEQKMRIQAAKTPEAKAREEQKLKILEARKEKAKIRYEARISDLEETIRMLEERLDEVRTEISALKQALGTPTAS